MQVLDLQLHLCSGVRRRQVAVQHIPQQARHRQRNNDSTLLLEQLLEQGRLGDCPWEKRMATTTTVRVSEGL